MTSLLVTTSMWAQWTKPAPPAVQEMKVGEECYLYNKMADGFLLGANDWNTRASVSQTLGHKVYIENGASEGSYYITNYVLQGGMKDQIGYMFMDNWDAIYVDNTKEGKKNNQYTFELQEGGMYKIGISPNNELINPKNYPDAYLGTIIPKNDTRIYLCDPENVNGYAASDYQLVWYIVSPEDYEAYTAASMRYNAAVELGESISEAESLGGVDPQVLAAAKGVYADISSTLDVLKANKKELDAAVFAAKLTVASPSNPVEVLAMFGVATDFNDKSTAGWTSTTGAQNKGADNGNNAKDFSLTNNHYENWNGSPFSVGKIYATLSDLSVGVYRLSALAFSNADNCSYLYAGASRKIVTSKQINVDEPMTIYSAVSGSNLEIGLDVATKGPNWVGLDNVYLEYLGNSAEAYSLMVDEVVNAEPDYEAMIDEGEAYCQHSVYETYKTALSALRSASSIDALSVAHQLFGEASEAMAASVAAYKVYADIVSEAEAFISSTTSESDEVILLSDYLADDTEANGLFNGNGGAPYILANGLLDDVQIKSEAEYINKVFLDAKANAKADGDDCTDLLVNADFASAGGWLGVTNNSIAWPTGKTEIYPVMQANNVACNVYQELTSLQNGLYEFNLQAAFRPGDVYTDEYEAIATAYAYINSFETKVPSGNLPDNVVVHEADNVSDAFVAGKFPVRVYGLVTDGTMKIGVTNKVRTVEGCRLWAGGCKLTFRGKNKEVLAEVIALTKPVADALLSSKAGRPELNALDGAIKDSETAADAYKALVDLKVAMENVEQGVQLYADLSVALKTLSDAIANSTNASAETLAEAKVLLDEAQSAYDGQTYDNAAAEQAVSDLNAMSVAVKMGGGSASENEPVDYTAAIVNNNFDPARGDKATSTIEGWTTTTLNGYKQNTASYNKNTFALSQKLTGLPKGNYKVTVHAFYRAGSYEEEEANINNGVDTHLAILYAQTSEKTYEQPVMNLSEGGVTSAEDVPEGASTKTINGIIVPDGTSASVAFYNAGYYLNELAFTVGEDGNATIGMHLDQTIGSNDYVVVGEWKLWYLGEGNTDINEQNVSDLIVNNNFDPARGDKATSTIEGWTTTTLNGYKQNTASYNKNTFALSQKLSGLPEGTYKVTVHAFYRAGSYEEEEANINSGADTHLTKFYAATSEKTYEKPVMNLSEGGVSSVDDVPEGASTKTINGIIVPDGTSASVAFYNAGYYLNELPFYVGADGVATIGMHLDQTIGTNDYIVVGEWNLFYYGPGNNIDTVTGMEDADGSASLSGAAPAAVYSVSGIALPMRTGNVNIVIMNNGAIRKVIK